MSIILRHGLRLVLLPILVFCFLGCSGATNNDQGTSFLALGFFADSTGAIGDAGQVVYMNEDVPAGSFSSAPVFPASLISYIGVQNRLSVQFMRTERMECTYTIAGADPRLVIPNDSNMVTTVVDANGGFAYIGVDVVSNDIFQFLSVNMNLTPELPFRMVAECWVIGVSQAGDTFTTNRVLYQIQFSERPECCTGTGVGGGGGFQEGPGVGGDIETFGDPEPEVGTAETDGAVVEDTEIAEDRTAASDALEEELLLEDLLYLD